MENPDGQFIRDNQRCGYGVARNHRGPSHYRSAAQLFPSAEADCVRTHMSSTEQVMKRWWRGRLLRVVSGLRA